MEVFLRFHLWSAKRCVLEIVYDTMLQVFFSSFPVRFFVQFLVSGGVFFHSLIAVVLFPWLLKVTSDIHAVGGSHIKQNCFFLSGASPCDRALALPAKDLWFHCCENSGNSHRTCDPNQCHLHSVCAYDIIFEAYPHQRH